MSRYIRDDQVICVYLKSGQKIEINAYGNQSVGKLVKDYESFVESGSPEFFSELLEKAGNTKDKQLLLQLRFANIEGITFQES